MRCDSHKDYLEETGAMTMSKNTEVPWSVRYTSTQDGKGGHCSVSIYKAAKNIMLKRVQGRLTLEDEANAEFIVKAVNAHDDMLEALEDAHLLLGGTIFTKEEQVTIRHKVIDAIAKAKKNV